MDIEESQPAVIAPQGTDDSDGDAELFVDGDAGKRGDDRLSNEEGTEEERALCGQCFNLLRIEFQFAETDRRKSFNLDCDVDCV